MDTTVGEFNGRKHVINPTLTCSYAYELVESGKQRLIDGRDSPTAPVMCRVIPACALRTAIEVHEMELGRYSGDEPIRSGLARAIWFEYYPGIVFGNRRTWSNLHNNRITAPSFEFIMMEVA